MFSLACLDDICSEIDRIQAGAADHVQGHSGGGHRKAGIDRCLSCDVLSLGSLDDAAHEYLIHILGLDARAVDRLADDDLAQLCSGGCGESAAHLTYCGAARAGNYDTIF